MLLSFEKLEGKDITVKQVKSSIAYSESQAKTLTGLGLRKIGAEVDLKCDKSIYGMLNKVKHLIDVKLK